MNKKLLTLILSAFTANAMAQVPTMGNEMIPVIGQKQIIYLADSVGIEPGASGANVTWDFSNLKPSANKDSSVSVILSPSKTPYGADYPNATAAGQSVSGSSYIYYNTDNNKVEIIGVVSQAQGFTLKHNYTNSLISYTTPITYNYKYSDDFAASYNVQGFDVYRYGTSNVNADAYGTLKIGNKTYNNVLRLHNTTHETDSIDYEFTSVLQYLDQDNYVFVTPGRKDALLTISYTTSRSSTQTVSSKSVTYNIKEIAAGMEEVNNSGLELNIYPNPASNYCHISLNAKEEMRGNIQLVNQLGQVVKTIENYNCHAGLNDIKLDLTDISKGIYFIKIQVNNAVSTQKIVVE